MKIKPLRSDLKDYLKSHNLAKKFNKAKKLFESNIKHPLLTQNFSNQHTEEFTHSGWT